MGSPADYTIIVLAVAIGVGVWTLLDRIGQVQRDLDAVKRRLGVAEPPEAPPQTEPPPSAPEE